MQRVTLKFPELSELSSYAKVLSVGYLINTCNLTLTGKLKEEEVQLAVFRYKAVLIDTTDKVFSY